MKRSHLWERALSFAFLCTIFVVSAACHEIHPPKEDLAAPRAVIVCWDGAKPAVIGSLLASDHLPVLQSLLKEGCWTWTAQTIFPSSTLPSHVSMLSGVPPAIHGVTWNSDRPDMGPLKVQTVFSMAKAAGLKTAMVVEKSKLRLLDMPRTVDADLLVEGGADDVARQALAVTGQNNPDLLFIHFGQADEAGHESGWGDTQTNIPPSTQYCSALMACDSALGTLVQGLKAGTRWDRTLLILTADHGGHETTHGSSDPQDMTIPWVAAGPLVFARGPLGMVVHTEDTAATALAALGIPVPVSWTGRPVPGILAPASAIPALKPAA